MRIASCVSQIGLTNNKWFNQFGASIKIELPEGLHYLRFIWVSE